MTSVVFSAIGSVVWALLRGCSEPAVGARFSRVAVRWSCSWNPSVLFLLPCSSWYVLPACGEKKGFCKSYLLLFTLLPSLRFLLLESESETLCRCLLTSNLLNEWLQSVLKWLLRFCTQSLYFEKCCKNILGVFSLFEAGVWGQVFWLCALLVKPALLIETLWANFVSWTAAGPDPFFCRTKVQGFWLFLLLLQWCLLLTRARSEDGPH